MNTARILKYVWPFYNIMHERVKVIKDNVDIFTDFICESDFKSSLFPSCLKSAHVTRLHKKGEKDL